MKILPLVLMLSGCASIASNEAESLASIDYCSPIITSKYSVVDAKFVCHDLPVLYGRVKKTVTEPKRNDIDEFCVAKASSLINFTLCGVAEWLQAP